MLFLNVLTPLMSLFFSIFLIFYDLGGTKMNCQGWERKKERRKFGVWGNFTYTPAATLVAEQGMYSMALEAIRE